MASIWHGKRNGKMQDTAKKVAYIILIYTYIVKIELDIHIYAQSRVAQGTRVGVTGWVSLSNGFPRYCG